MHRSRGLPSARTITISKAILAAWCAMEKAYKAGRLRAIGVSNFQQVDIENLLQNGDVKPMVNQILAHVSNTPFALIDYCHKHDILVEAYSPMGHGEMMKNRLVQDMANRYGVSIARLCIRYCLQLGLLPLPKTANPEHMEANADVDFEISGQDMEILKNVERIRNYGEASLFPVYGGKLDEKGKLYAKRFFQRITFNRENMKCSSIKSSEDGETARLGCFPPLGRSCCLQHVAKMKLSRNPIRFPLRRLPP